MKYYIIALSTDTPPPSVSGICIPTSITQSNIDYLIAVYCLPLSMDKTVYSGIMYVLTDILIQH